MLVRRFKSFTVAAFSIFLLVFSLPALADDGGEKEGGKKDKLNVGEVIFDHVLDGHEFHFFGVSIPLPVILYSPEKGFSSFMSSSFHHGEHDHEGYRILTKHNIEEMGLDPKTFKAEQIIAVDVNGAYDPTVKVYDFSLTRNVVQMILALTLFTIIMLRIAKI